MGFGCLSFRVDVAKFLTMKTSKKRAGFWVLAAILILFLAWSIWTPIPFGILKIAALFSIFALFSLVVWNFKRPKWALLALIPIFVVGLWPFQAPDAANLRANYLRSLQNYSGTRYVWGGENARGIDCSGLMRRAMIDALISQGFAEKNPSLWREAMAIWWRDCSAREMKNGYGGRTATIFAAKNLNVLDYSQLQSGDLAVMQSGVHVLAFVGGKTWIQADPNLVNGGDKVITTTAPSKNGWFGQEIEICRWRILD